MTTGVEEDRDWQRLDKWMWCARFLKARAECARLVGEGLVRLNRQATDKPHARVRPGDMLTLPLRGDVLVIQVLALAARRGPATEARALYTLVEDRPIDQSRAEGDECRAGLRDAGIDCISGPAPDPSVIG